MKLSEAKNGEVLTITNSLATGRTRARLDSLGLVSGASVKVFSSSWVGIIVTIKGSHLALSKDIARLLEVS